MKFFVDFKNSSLLLGFIVNVLVSGSARTEFIYGTRAEIGTQAHGTLVAWGLNDDGQCNVPRGNDFVAISGGHWHSLALRVNGSLVSWGSISEAPSGNDFVAIASGAGHNLALKADGSLVAWGGTAYGKCDVPEGNNFVAIAARGEHNLALKADGSIVAWGLNNWGQCDVPEGNDFVSISAGHSHSVAIKADGSLVSWGQLTEVPPGNDFVAISAGPMHNLALRADGSLASAGGRSEWHENNVPAGNDFVKIATGSWHCLDLKADGSVVAWGRNLYGECDVPRILSARKKAKAVAIAGAEGFHSLAIVAPQPDRQEFYFNDFEGVVGDEWSSRRTDVTPAGARGFLGQFGDENVTLTLRNLPAHTQVTVSFDLFILRSWDGNNQVHGPDVWQLKVDEGPILLYTTFANVPPDIKDFNQAYPGSYPGGDYLPYTGAEEIKTLGYTEIPSPAPDSVYHLSYTFAHTSSILGLDFSGQGLQGIRDESWGLDNVKVMISQGFDFNGDGKVDIEDLTILIEHWGQDEPLVDIAPPPFGDGIVDMKDLELFMSHWGEVLPEKIVYIQWLGHSTVKVWTEDCIVYVDPERVPESLHDATLVCVTHSHGDHYSPSDIAKVSNPQTQFIAPPDVVQQHGRGQAIAPGQTIEFDNVNIIAVPSYNTNKTNHPKSRNWVGFIIELGSKRIYVAGDTDLIDEMKSLGDIDVAILPAGGTYTMNAVEAAEATQYIKPELAIPYHWGQSVGTLNDAQTFAEKAACAVKIMTVGETISSDNWPKYSPLIAHWELDETEGNIAQDSAGNNDGICNGEPLWQPAGGKVNGAIQLDGIDDYVSTDFVLNPADGAFSAFTWIKGGAAGQAILSQTDGTGSGEIWLGLEASQGKLMSGLVSPPAGRTVPQPLVSESVITNGQWHHIGFVWDGSQRYLYVDGIEAARDTKALAGLKASDGGLYIGAGKTLDAASFFSGLIDEVRIYNRAMGAEDIEELAR